ncbi:hypothetical protein OE766_24935 [Pararhizobium sp. YC-54]|uniref:hypothetical protein n=1 Tax=Pararhizobium sp. YC-54 TaxID=2986920 RepID=UPI0021F7A1A6|nr:hypothetical protein [Pararhizobium sp. YC-54]MCW0001471.1 hypothetical protein [Pararhizobium sp. YC-54]
MNKTFAALAFFSVLLPGIASAQSPSSIVPVLTGAYAPAEGGCDAAAAAFIYIENSGIGANKTTGKVTSVKHEGKSYVLDVLWIEAGATEADGDRDTVRIEVKDDRSFYFSNSASKKTLMRWCN